MREEKQIPALNQEDKDFFLNLYEEYIFRISCAAARYALNKSDQEDLIQDTLIRLIRNIPTIKQLDSGQIASYIGITVRAVYMDFLKKESWLVPIDDDMIERLQLGHYHRNILEHDYIIYQDCEKIRRELPSRDWYVLEATYLLERSKDEMAHSLGVDPDSLRMILYRARKKARKILAEDDT